VGGVSSSSAKCSWQAGLCKTGHIKEISLFLLFINIFYLCQECKINISKQIPILLKIEMAEVFPHLVLYRCR
jgi:hypothetical protein